MVSALNRRAKQLQKHNFLLLSLIFAVRSALLFALCLLPLPFMHLAKLVSAEFLALSEKTVNLILSLLVFLIVFSLMSLLSKGIRRFYFRRAQGKTGDAGDLFFYFSPKQVLFCWAFSIKLRALKTVFAIFVYAPFLISLFRLAYSLYRGASVKSCGVFFLAVILFFLSGTAFYFKLSSFLFLCPYYFVSDNYDGFLKTVKVSADIMKNKGRSLLKLKLSFWRWHLLSLLLLPLSYVQGRCNQTLALAAKEFMSVN